MTVFSFIRQMKEMSTPVAYIAVGILGLFLIFIIFKMLFGMRRGTWRQLVRTAATLVAAAASFILGTIASNKIVGSLDVKNFEGLIQEIEAHIPKAGDVIRKALGTIDTDMIEYIILLPAAIILIPILTTALFLVINLIFKIIRAILIKILKFKKAKTNPQRLGGAILAAIEGIIWITMILFPLTGILTLVDTAYNQAIDSQESSGRYELQLTYDEYLRPFTENPVFTFVEKVGADAMTNSIATVKIDNKKTNMRDEVLGVARIIIVDAKTLKGADFTDLNAEEKDAVESIAKVLVNSPFMSRVIVGVMQTVPSVYNSDLVDLNFDGEYEPVIDTLMAFLEDIRPDTLEGDVDTILNFYFGFCDSGLLSAMSEGNDIIKFINDDYKGERHILTMINTLSGNDRTKPILDSLYNFVLKVAFAGSDEEGENSPLADIEIENVREGLNNIVSVNRDNYDTHEEYRDALSSTISDTINDTIGVTLEQETVDEIADYIDENYAEQIEDLTDEEFNEIMFEVMDIYQSYLNGEEILPDDLEDLLPGGSGEATDPDHVHTEVVIDAVPASCTQYGSTKGIYCPGCGETILEPTLIPMTDHVYTDKYDSECNNCGHKRDAECRHSNTEVVRGYAATCSKTGLTDGKKCADCGATITAQKSISKLNCTEGDWIIDKVPTTTETGAKHTECTICGKIISRETIDMIPMPSEGLAYSYDEYRNGYVLCGIGTCTDTDLVVPDSYEGIPVVGVSTEAFSQNQNITSVILPETVVYIGRAAFLNCTSLTSINLPDGITELYSIAFAYCSSLKSIKLPDSLGRIQDEMFLSCTSLTTVTLGESNRIIGYKAFKDCTSLKTVNMGSSLENIYDDAFANCKSLTSITLPDTMEGISSDAFSNCTSLYSINIPISVTYISGYAFRNCYNLTVSCEAGSQPSAWSSSWSKGVKKVYWGR